MKGFVFIYYSDSARNKKLLPRSEFGHFLGMDSSTRDVKVYLPHTKKIRSVRQSDFRIYKGDVLPSVELMLDGIGREVEKEQEFNQANSGKIVTQAFIAVVS